MKLVLFDCDGTLVDSAGFIHTCMVRTFEEAGLPPPRSEDTKSIIGLSLPLAIERLLGHQARRKSAADLAERYKQHFVAMRAASDTIEPLFEGISGLMETLSRREDILTGVVTGKSRRGLTLVLAGHGLDDHFSCRRTADDCPSKPHPAMVVECCHEVGLDPADAVVVGDTSFDMQMATAAGAGALGVKWGYHSQATLLEAGAGALLTRPHDLLDHI